jgi:hypothetical protein
MNACEGSLRWLVHKWIGSASADTYRLTRSRQAQGCSKRCVCLEAPGQDSALKIFFFRHDDGSWSVLPPEPKRPAFRWLG